MLLTPDAEESGLDLAATAKKVGRRPLLIWSSAEDAPRGWTALKEVLAFPEADFRTLEGTLVRGTAAFGKVAGFEATLASWIADRPAYASNRRRRRPGNADWTAASPVITPRHSRSGSTCSTPWPQGCEKTSSSLCWPNV